MRRILFFFFLALSVHSLGQELKRSNVFDFSNPLGLSTPITPSPENGGNAALSGISFVNGKAVISFDHAVWAPSPYISTYINPYTDEVSYFLNTPSGSKVIVSTTDGATLDSIDFEGTMGGLVLAKDEPGVMIGSLGKHWEDTASIHPSNLTFVTNSQNGNISKMLVHFTEPAVVLKPISSSVGNNDTLPQFQTISFTFDRNIYVNDSSMISVTVDGEQRDFTVKTLNHVATITLADVISEDALIKVLVPASSFRDTKEPYASITNTELKNVTGYENIGFSYQFWVRVPRNTLNYISATPAEGIVEMIPPVIKLDFRPEGNDSPAYNLKGEKLATLVLMKDDAPYCNVTIAIDHDIKSQVNLTLEDVDSITIPGTWRLTIPEKFIHNTFIGNDAYDRWNPEITLTYIIKEPEPEPEPEPTETMQLAKELLDNPVYTGIGYPTETCLSRKELKEALDTISAPSTANDSLLSIAIGKFYNETDVNMPIAGKWYSIVGVNATEKPDSIYLSYNGERVALSGEKQQAAAFEVSYDNGKIMFRTSDNKYLHVLTNSEKYAGTSPANVTTGTPGAINKLNLSKLVVEGADSTKTFGKLSLSGLLGIDENQNLDFSSVAISYIDTTLVDVPTHTLYFDTERSSAILLTETKNPTVIVPEVFLEDIVLEEDTCTTRLVFKNVNNAHLVNADKVFVKYHEDAHDVALRLTASAILTPKEGIDNSFVLHVNGLDGRADTLYYELVIPADVFDYSENPLRVTKKEFRLKFQIKGYNYNYNVINWVEHIRRAEAGLYYIADTDLNEFTLYSYLDHPYDALIADTTKVITIKGFRTIRTGHFKPYSEFSQMPGQDEYQAIKLVLDTPIEAGELDYEPGEYTYDIPRGTYGDGNFGRYLENHTSVDKTVCIANRPLGFTVYVDNEKAAANGIAIVRRQMIPADYFDLQGRRIIAPSKPGVYIINGKKHVIK